MHNKPCLFSEEQIKAKIKEMYPLLEEKEINYHADKVLYNDWLKVSDREEDLEEVIKEQVEDLFNK